MENEFRMLPLELLDESTLNPRHHFDQEKLDELAASVKSQGVLEPLLVRKIKVSVVPGAVRFEIVAGARRFRAANQAGLDEVPVRVVELDDLQALEVMVVENGQREDVHPLEEAQGFHLLHTRAKLDAARIAEKIGRSTQYVYDRLKLLSLTKDAQRLFLSDRFTAGHAVILARLTPEDQARALDFDGNRYNGVGGLWQSQQLVIHPDAEDEEEEAEQALKPVSVKELQSWVDMHTKLEATDVDQMVMPGTAMTLQVAAEQDERVVRITHDVMTPDETKDGPRVVLGRSWRRADGQRGSKQCEHSVIGMVVIGAGRGEAFRVCVNKKRCEVHWGELIKAAKKRDREVTKGAATGEDRAATRRRLDEQEKAKKAAEDARWEKAEPAILAACAAAVRKGATGAGGVVGKFVLGEVLESVLYDRTNKTTASVSLGKTGDDLLRHLAYRILEHRIAEDLQDNWGRDAFAKIAKAFGIDLGKIVDQAAPIEAAATAKTVTKAKGKGTIARKKKAAKAA